jgi:glycolate oxidase FAD binding subunit
VDVQLRSSLAAIAGPGNVDDPLDAVSPGSTEEVVAVCRACAGLGTPISVVSGRVTRPAPGGRAVCVSLARLDHIRVEAGAMVARAGAGARIDALRTAVDGAAMALVGVPAGAGSTASRAGSLVARGEVPRRALTGIEAVLCGGEVVHAGGAVLKDVTGYDLGGALLGSMGRLALVTEVVFRLRPRAGRAAAAEAPAAAAAEVSGPLRLAFDPEGLLVAAR